MEHRTDKAHDEKGETSPRTPVKTIVFELSVEDAMKRDAEYGRKIPVELLSILEETAYETFHNWLENNGAPEEVTSMVMNIENLSRQVATLKAGEDLADFEYADILPTIADVSKLISDFGGSFFSEYRDPTPHESVITWAVPSPAPHDTEQTGAEGSV